MDIAKIAGQNIKRVREDKHLSLEIAAELTGVSRSMLSQIERGETNPTITVLWKIAQGYKVSFTTLIEQTESAGAIIRGKDVPSLTDVNSGYENYPVFLFDPETRFETYRIVIQPGGGLEAQPHLPGTEEYITVFAGSVQITISEEVYTLDAGDSLRFRADAPHIYQNMEDSPAELSMLLYYHR